MATGVLAGCEPAETRSGRSAARWPWLVAVVRAVAGTVAGLLLLVSFPPFDGWWLAPFGVALLAVATAGCRLWGGAGVGLLCGAGLFVPLLAWTGMHTGWMPWLTLAALEAAFVGVLGAVSAWSWPLVAARPWVAVPLVGALWTGQEFVRGRAPFGGFPWGRLAFGQGDSPVLRLAGLGGAPLVTFAVAASGGLLVAVGLLGWRALRAPERGRVGLWSVTAGALVAVVGVLGCPVTVPDGPELTVAIVQGNVPRLGLDFNAQRRAVLDNHVTGTVALAAQVDSGAVPRPDLVVWPENSSDIDPLVHADAAERIEEAAVAVGAPILVGAVLEQGERALNAGLLWLPGRGVEQRYVKRHPVPFAEYVPLRDLVRRVTTKVDLVRVDFVGGDRPGVLRVGQARVGDVICFEVAYDGLVRDVVLGGAGLIVVQTNNATFNPAEAAQQLAMVRLRAVEHGRPALMASTVGISGFVGADGRVRQATGFNTAAVRVERLRLGSWRTPATVLGPVVEYLIVAGLGVGLGVAGWRRRGRRPGRW